MFNRFLVNSGLGEASFLDDDLSFLYRLLLTAELISYFYCRSLGSLGNMLGVTRDCIREAGVGVIVLRPLS
jgi:hypothetical protein